MGSVALVQSILGFGLSTQWGKKGFDAPPELRHFHMCADAVFTPSFRRQNELLGRIMSIASEVMFKT